MSGYGAPPNVDSSKFGDRQLEKLDCRQWNGCSVGAEISRCSVENCS